MTIKKTPIKYFANNPGENRCKKLYENIISLVVPRLKESVRLPLLKVILNQI